MRFKFDEGFLLYMFVSLSIVVVVLLIVAKVIGAI